MVILKVAFFHPKLSILSIIYTIMFFQDRAAEHLANVEKEYKGAISQLERKLQNVEKDRNILMVRPVTNIFSIE